MAIDVAVEKHTPAVYCQYWLVNLMVMPFELWVHRPSTQCGAGMKRDEKALVILTIFTDQYPFMLLLSVHLAPAVTISYPSFLSLCFPFPPFLPPASIIYSSNTEALYQLGRPRCGPQSSIEGLEDTEVGLLWTPSRYIHEQLRCRSISFTKYVSFSTPNIFCRANVRPMCCCLWCTGETSWTQQVGTLALRLAMWPPWPQCWRRWRGCISRLLRNMWWSNWCHVQPCALKPSPWCPSECCGQDTESRWPHLHSLFQVSYLQEIQIYSGAWMFVNSLGFSLLLYKSSITSNFRASPKTRLSKEE